ncbi:YiiX/YebB-like N1pC/P60 family cysteine hydrolase [Rhodohalobacter sp.]|uniref:YiiX/YebB-like N1pC/P60 family cysteine hydrolase n=1 Tax=Rhodohalobacter sp. TaxID=1974210 RepID=UPI002ACE8838|nr:YiiX/YebB-like N1pC/P60 family cysteine hydrolase [Rhodohalobacter sp.]MDZ7755552.1 YiiX/YebB-like N1pC/P60 family cysteine hydrolase [Rhodohalobacter sp.]
MDKLLNKFGYRLAHYLSHSNEDLESVSTCSREELESALKKGDVLLVDGSSRVSTAIKYITQSTWSHAALYIGKRETRSREFSGEPELIEADLRKGVQAVPLSTYCHMHTRICRPVGLSEDEIQKVVRFMKDKIGYKYDLKNIFDLARYLIQSPPVPQKHRRRLLALGSGDPTKAICSSLIAQAYQLVEYPILPVIDVGEGDSKAVKKSQEEILHIRHHSLFAPRDFDVSPYFKIIKPTIRKGFDHHKLNWADD